MRTLCIAIFLVAALMANTASAAPTAGTANAIPMPQWAKMTKKEANVVDNFITKIVNDMSTACSPQTVGPADAPICIGLYNSLVLRFKIESGILHEIATKGFRLSSKGVTVWTSDMAAKNADYNRRNVQTINLYRDIYAAYPPKIGKQTSRTD